MELEGGKLSSLVSLVVKIQRGTGWSDPLDSQEGSSSFSPNFVRFLSRALSPRSSSHLTRVVSYKRDGNERSIGSHFLAKATVDGRDGCEEGGRS
ncbi:hypothetical protein BDY24DRAFT_80034 [Mrakia frigida]|uniref:uncharacterized protein n=1 Tax=Mrakia frigida TaxID=29902 RepID=UPI003FCC02A3